MLWIWFLSSRDLYGKLLDICVSTNLNPKTIRHIVGVPNHIRVWKRNVYWDIGGYNRRISVADDYELVVRTFLKTKMLKIPKLGYLQFIHNSGQNTHNVRRNDIQRRIRTIADFYNQQIHDRFIELGKKDWAFDENPTNPLMTPSRFGDDEEYVNGVYED